MHAFNEMSLQISQYLKELEKKESEKLQLNDSIQKIKRLSQLGEFSAKMAHELKNPISILNFCLQDATEAIDSNDVDSARGELSKCLKALERIKITASKLGAKSNYSEKEELSITELFNEIENMYRALVLKENISLKLDNQLSRERVKAPRLELTGAFSNLIDNALEHIRANEMMSRDIGISLSNDSKYLSIKISNAGSEIKNAQMIFNSFHTTKGSELRGLGLIIVKDVVDECKGKVSYCFENNLNIFEVKLPLA